MSEKTYLCPECGSNDLIVRAVTSYNLNTDEFYCHSVKTHDSDAVVDCLDCNWTATRDYFERGES